MVLERRPWVGVPVQWTTPKGLATACHNSRGNKISRCCPQAPTAPFFIHHTICCTHTHRLSFRPSHTSRSTPTHPPEQDDCRPAHRAVLRCSSAQQSEGPIGTTHSHTTSSSQQAQGCAVRARGSGQSHSPSLLPPQRGRECRYAAKSPTTRALVWRLAGWRTRHSQGRSATQSHPVGLCWLSWVFHVVSVRALSHNAPPAACLGGLRFICCWARCLVQQSLAGLRLHTSRPPLHSTSLFCPPSPFPTRSLLPAHCL